MGNDLGLVVGWWGILFLVGVAAYPFTKSLFNNWYDRGYLFAKAVGLVIISYLVWLSASLHLLPFGIPAIILAMIIVFAVGVILIKYQGKFPGIFSKTRINLLLIIFAEELFFFAALLFWSYIKGHEASIRGLEKFMDYGFTMSILKSSFFPPPDMWYSGGTINYYYFGHFVMALLTKLSGIDLRYTFNLMLSTLFAFTFTMSFGIAYQLLKNSKSQAPNHKQILKIVWNLRFGIWNLGGAFLTAFLVTLAGNMQTIYAFTRGYTGDDVKPFWDLLWPIGEFFAKLPEGMQTYWYANATRFIPFTIHEFPSYSFVVSDVHGHVLSLPFVLLAIALLIRIFGDRDEAPGILHHIFYGILVAVLFMTNALDGPIYLGLFIVLAAITLKPTIFHPGAWFTHHGMKLVWVFIAGPAVLPFVLNFKSFVAGVAVNCPPAGLADNKFGLFLFETVDKCQHSPLWMMWLLWGFFIYAGVWFLVSRLTRLELVAGTAYSRAKLNLKISLNPAELVLVVMFLYSLLLIIFPEFFYFKDIYPAHFRSNTMFKLGYEAFIMFSILAGYTIVNFTVNRQFTRKTRIIFWIFLIPQLFLVCIYPYFSVRSYFGNLTTYSGLNGTAWMSTQYPDDFAAIEWLNNRGLSFEFRVSDKSKILPVIAEADGDSYTDYARVSAFTGYPTIIGWAVHEWLWRGSYDVVAPRREDVRQIYEIEDESLTRQLMAKYDVKFVFVGTIEREKYPQLREEKLARMGTRVFNQGGTSIYRMDR